MSRVFTVHPEDPQARLIRQAADVLAGGGVIVYPTDSCYALGCRLDDKDAMERIRRIRDLDPRRHFTLVCRTLAECGVYGRIDDRQYRTIRSLAPGPYVFILAATREVPRRLVHARRKTIGLRIPRHRVAEALLAQVGEPLVSSTLILPGHDLALDDAAEIQAEVGSRVDLILDAGNCGTEPSTVIDMTGDEPVVTRAGRGAVPGEE